MARKPTITDEHLLGAAREVFLERGVNATSAEVAQRAGVSEGTLFKRFKTKHEMFHCALDIDGEGEEWERTMPDRVGIGDPQEQLAQLLKDGIKVLRIIVPLVLTSSVLPSAPSDGPRVTELDGHRVMRACGHGGDVHRVGAHGRATRDGHHPCDALRAAG